MASSEVVQRHSAATQIVDERCCRTCSLKSDDWNRHFKDPKLFRHQPLDTSRGSIRLLHLLPQQCDGIIRCELQHALLPQHEDQDSNLCYQAVSYTWGRRYSHKWIFINNQRYLVRQNLWRLLSELAKSDLAGGETLHNLWIDALCTYSSRSGIKHCSKLEVRTSVF